MYILWTCFWQLPRIFQLVNLLTLVFHSHALQELWQGLPLMSWPAYGRDSHHETRVMRDDVMSYGDGDAVSGITLASFEVPNPGRYHIKLEIEWSILLFILDSFEGQNIVYKWTAALMHTKSPRCSKPFSLVPSFTAKHTKSQAARFTRRTWGTTWHVTVTWAFQWAWPALPKLVCKSSNPMSLRETFMFPASMIFLHWAFIHQRCYSYYGSTWQ